MLRYPDEGEIVEYGDALGLHLSTTEARLMQSRMAEVLASLESFWAMQVEEQRLPSSYHTRDPGYRPSPQEDPLNLLISPNPPKDTDGRREDSGRGWVRELQGRWPGVLG